MNTVATRAIWTIITLNSGEQFRAILALLFQNYIKYDIVACNSNSRAYKNQQIFASKSVFNFQMEFGLADIEKWTKIKFRGEITLI